MTSVEIEYCHPCGFLPRAQDVQESVLETHGERIDDVTLSVGDSGVFKVWVDGELVYDKAEEGYDEDAILEAVDERVPATA